jgi:hypothetical protein
MRRHYNFTARTRINHDDIVVEYDPTAPSRFRLNVPHDLVTDPTKQKVFVEIDTSGSPHLTRHELPWGEGGASQDWLDLGGIPARQARFTIKVVETNGDGMGRILKLARNIQPGRIIDGGERVWGREGLIHIQRDTMVEQIWRLEFQEEPVLLVNQELAMSDDELTRHPAFRALIYPEICRRCLGWAIYEMDIAPTEGIPEPDQTDKASLWVKFALTTLPADAPPPRPVDGWTVDNRREMNEWIDRVVTRVSSKHRFMTAMGTGKQEGIK